MRFFTLFLLLGVVSCSLSAQDLHIYYNVHKDSMWYMKNGKSITNLELKKDKVVLFHLVEFNNYIYKAGFDARQTSNPYSVDGTDSSSTQELMPSLLSGLVQQGGNGLPMFNMPGIGSLITTLTGLGGNASRGSLEEVEQVQSALKILEADKQAINTQIAEINKRKKAITLLKGDFSFINTLCLSPTVQPSTIKELSLRYFSDVFCLSDKATFDIKNITEYNRTLQETPQLETALDLAIKSYEENYKKLEKSMSKLKNADHGIDELYPLIKKFEAGGPSVYQSLKKYSPENGASASAAGAADFSPVIQNNYLKYQEILNNDFTYTHQVKCEDKYLFYNLELFRKDSASQASGAAAAPVRIVKVKVNSYSTVRVSSSVGLSAGKFAVTPQKFFIKNDVLTAQDVDPFLPMVTSLVHVGFDFRGLVTPALSLGVGVPITKNDASDNMAFLLGPSVFFGKKKEFAVSGGVMYAKVQRVSKGFEVGDAIQIGDGDIPTEKKYELGYFLSFTYNLGGS